MYRQHRNMEYGVFVLIFCLFPKFRYSAALTSCCYVDRKEWKIHVTCLGCQLREIPPDLPINTTSLNLRNNSIVKLDRDSFTYLPQLEYLTLSKNGMYRISPEAFSDVRDLKYLDLSENYLEHSTFDHSVFKHLLKLEYLYLHSNNFHLKIKYPEKAISCITSLQSLKIDIFDGFSFGKGFLNLTKLRELQVFHTGANRVSIRNTSFRGLEKSEISHLNLKFRMKNIAADSLSPFGRLVSLTLDSCRSLQIHEVLKALNGLRERNMESIKLSSNFLVYGQKSHLEKSDLIFLGTICVRKLDLSRNGILGISMEAILSWTTKGCLEILDVSRNVINSPHLFSLLVLFPSLTHAYVSYEVSIFSRKRRSLNREQITVFVPKSLRYLYLSHNPFGGYLPNITLSDGNNIYVLDISYPIHGLKCGNGLIRGLIHVKELYISGIKCQHSNDEMFAEFPSLSRLEAKECDLGRRLSLDAKSLFAGLYKLSFIDLAYNNIKALDSNVLKDQSHSLTYLNLTGNSIDHLPLETLKDLRDLETIDMRNNRLNTLSDHERSFLDSSEKLQIKLGGNPFVCSCDNLDFISWFNKTKTVLDRENISCITAEGNEIKFSEFVESYDEFYSGCVSKFWLLISISLTLVCMSFGIFFRLAWRRSVRLRMICHRPSELDRYEYDIFISYGYEDSNWVAKTLVPWLDKSNIEYCFDEKSFDLLKDNADNIMDAIDKSRQTVFVVSCSFMEHEWPLFTMQLTSAYSIRDGRESMNIIILLDDMKRSEFPRLIRKNWDFVRPLKWPNGNKTKQGTITEHRFWKRLLQRIQGGHVHSSPTYVQESHV